MPRLARPNGIDLKQEREHDTTHETTRPRNLREAGRKYFCIDIEQYCRQNDNHVYTVITFTTTLLFSLWSERNRENDLAPDGFGKGQVV
ncbi:MAG: hypothetical protein L3J18_12035 [Candidatus Brocadia sp.]|nr:MAG: hypothetical protein L3J18_12035 [Candidatus Brocadia sp.]